MAGTWEIPATLKAMLVTAGLTSLPTSWSLQCSDDGYSVNLKWGATQPVAGNVSNLQQGAPKIITRKTPSMLRRDQRRQEEYKARKQHESQSQRPVCTLSPNAPPFTPAQNCYVETQSNSVQTYDQSTQIHENRKDASVQTVAATSTVSKEKSVQTVIHGQDRMIQTENEKCTEKHQPASQNEKSSSCEKKPTFKTEAVLKKRTIGNKTEFLVKFQDQPSTKNRWIPYDDLDSSAFAFIIMNHSRIPTQHPKCKTKKEIVLILSYSERKAEYSVRYADGNEAKVPAKAIPKEDLAKFTYPVID